jgi:predicted nucleic acid-binding protein
LSERAAPQQLVLDTSVAVKFYLPENLREEALARS